MRLTLATLLLGGTLIYLGLALEGIALLLTWLGFSFFLTGLGYAGFFRANVFRKNEFGQIPFNLIFLHCPFLLYTWLVWHLIRLMNRENAYDRIDENMIIGRRLLEREYPNDIINIIDLTIEFNEPYAIVEKTNYIFLPILDGSVPDLAELEKALSILKDGLTYIHCAQGHGRTGLIAALVLARHKKIRHVEEALLLLKSKRPKLSLTKAQKEFLQTCLAKKSGFHCN